MSKSVLHAGNLETIYDSGSLRYIRLGNEELLRGIYVALRDAEWGTLSPIISNEKIVCTKNGFAISYDCPYTINGLTVFRWHVIIEGDQKNEIVFSISGFALTTFQKNRAGLCVLHPIKTCAGQSCEITSTKGEVLENIFPVFIAPHQPFTNIKKMRWKTPEKNICEITFEGDIFETEDQRNWTDASYKTYSTPLCLPFPTTLHAGETIHQQILFSVVSPKHFSAIKTTCENNIVLEFDLRKALSLPKIGTSRADTKPGEQSISWLRKLQLDHYRTNLKLYEDNWHSHFEEANSEAQRLGTKLSLALHLRCENDLMDFISTDVIKSNQLKEITVLGPSKITESRFIEKQFPQLKKKFPGIQIGAGTDCYFAELNRNIMHAPLPDFISFSINPQVHAFDNLTLIENMEAQYDAVISAKKLYPTLPVHISPVTLKPRFNPNSKEYLSGNLQYDRNPDRRQHTLFALAWTLGSIRNLAAAGAAAITFFQSVGDNGIISENHDTQKTILSPEYLLLSLITQFKKAQFFAGICNDPLKCTGILMNNYSDRRWIIANHTDQNLFVRISNLEGASQLREISSHNSNLHLYNPYLFLISPAMNINSSTVQLNPQSIVVIDQKISKAE